jgi:hypothetical protein
MGRHVAEFVCVVAVLLVLLCKGLNHHGLQALKQRTSYYV